MIYVGHIFICKQLATAGCLLYIVGKPPTLPPKPSITKLNQNNDSKKINGLRNSKILELNLNNGKKCFCVISWHAVRRVFCFIRMTFFSCSQH